MPGKVGLALGAGSAKGFAHIGVLQVLEENHIPVDMISGSSMGAIIGSIYAVGTNLSLLRQFIRTINVRDYLDLSNPVSGGLVRGDRIEELIRVFTHNKDFGQTRIPFLCVAVDAEKGELVVLNEGKLHKSVRASMSIPGIFTPAEVDGHFYVDGGIIDRVPCRVLKEHGMDVVIGVDVGYRGGGFDLSVSNPYQQINHTLDIMQWEITKLRTIDADIVLIPHVRELVKGRISISGSDACVEEGRRVTREALPEILRILEEKGIPLRQ